MCLGLMTVAGKAAPPKRTASRTAKAPVPVQTPAAHASNGQVLSKNKGGSNAAIYSRLKANSRRSYAAAAPAQSRLVATRPVAVVPRSFTPAGPSSDRYREIQQALADKGYYKGAVDGTWTSESQEALRRFQADQNLSSTGKLDSLSLIALGLGPKRDTSASLLESPGMTQ